MQEGEQVWLACQGVCWGLLSQWMAQWAGPRACLLLGCFCWHRQQAAWNMPSAPLPCTACCMARAGNRPSLSILLPELNAYTLGQLLRWVAGGVEACDGGHRAKCGTRRGGAPCDQLAV